MTFTDRIARLRQQLAENELDGILVSQPQNRYYLSGFRSSEGYLLMTHENTIIAVDFRYIEQAKRQCPDYELFQIKGSMADWFPQLVSGLGLKKLAFEASDVSFALYRQLANIMTKSKLTFRLVPTERLVELLRIIKEPEEIEFITKAISISDGACEYVQSVIHAGMTELEIAWEIEKFMREHGSEALPFDIIVASGPNAALPHASASDRRIGEGEPVLIDIGARCNGYGSDLSRTLCVGSPNDTYKKIYDTILGAQLSAIELIKEGMTGEEADALARTVVEEGGYGEAFGHALGHGVGLAPHEAPRLGTRSTDILTNGMVFTIEPGIYISGWGGVRIEDIGVMENGRVKILSHARKIFK